MARKTRQQPRVKGIVRTPTHTSLLPAIEKAVDKTAKMFGVTKSWVRATALAHYFGIKEQETYHQGKVVPMRRRA